MRDCGCAGFPGPVCICLTLGVFQLSRRLQGLGNERADSGAGLGCSGATRGGSGVSGLAGGAVLAEEADDLGAGVGPVGVGVGAVRDAAGPGMPGSVDDPALGEGCAGGILVA